MLLKMVPGEVANTLGDMQSRINTAQLAIDHLKTELSRYASTHFAANHEKLNDARLVSALRTPINAMFERHAQQLKAMQSTMDSVCADFNSRAGR